MDIFFTILIATGAVAAALIPLARGLDTTRSAPATGPGFRDDDAIEAEVARYRDSLRAGTLCRRCRFPNPAGSNFCADCGRPLGGGGD